MPKTITVLPDKRGRRRLAKFEQAVRDHAFKGAQMPEDHPAIEQAYDKAKAAMLAHLDDQALTIVDQAGLREGAYDQLKQLAEMETAWNGGISKPWKGDALTSPWFLERLCQLATYAPQAEIDKLAKDCGA